MRRPDAAEAAAACWALAALAVCKRQLHSRGIGNLHLPPSVALPARGLAGVNGVLRLAGSTCLTRCCVLQAWFADHGRPLDLVIGITAPARGFSAHSWLEEAGESRSRTHSELARLPPPRGAPAVDALRPSRSNWRAL